MSFPVSIPLPRSKSIIIRCLIVNYIRNGTLLPILEDDPNDIKIVYNALKTIDLQKKNSAGCEIVIDVEDCGSAYRFLMPLLATTKGKWLLTGTKRLLQRPILPLVNFLHTNGAIIEKTELGWYIECNELKINNFEIDATETSQYASALMMVGERRMDEIPRSARNDEGVPEGRGSLDKSPYIMMTQTLIQTNNLSPFLNLADWSAAVFWFANAMLAPNAHYFLQNLHFDGLQGDAAIVSWFEEWGLVFTKKETGIEVKQMSRVEISEQQIDVIQTPDIAMILAVLSVCYPFKLTMSGVKNLNLKESNRLDILIKELSKFTKIEKKSEDIITIYKRCEKLPEKFHFDSHNDHRFVMAWTLFKNFGELNITNPECIKKSYPTFNHLISNSSSFD